MIPIFSCGVLLFSISVTMFTPIFVYYVTAIGGNYMDYGVIITISSIVASLIQPFVGYVSDKRGARLMITIGCSAVVVSLFATAFGLAEWHLILLFTILQVGVGCVVPTLYYSVCHIELRNKKSFIPYYRTIQGVGVITGPLIGGAIAHYSLKLNLFVAALVCFVSFCCLIIFLPRTVNEKMISENGTVDEFTDNEESDKENFIKAFIRVATHKQFLGICVLFLLLELAFDIVSYNTPILGESLKVDTTLIGAAESAYFIVFTLFQIPVNNKLQKYKTKKSLVIMGSLSLLSGMFFIVDASFYVIIIAMALSGLTMGSLFTYCTVIASKIAPSNRKGIYLGVFNMIQPMTDIISPITVVLLFGIKARLPFIFALILILAFTLVALFQKKMVFTINQK